MKFANTGVVLPSSSGRRSSATSGKLYPRKERGTSLPQSTSKDLNIAGGKWVVVMLGSSGMEIQSLLSPSVGDCSPFPSELSVGLILRYSVSFDSAVGVAHHVAELSAIALKLGAAAAGVAPHINGIKVAALLAGSPIDRLRVVAATLQPKSGGTVIDACKRDRVARPWDRPALRGWRWTRLPASSASGLVPRGPWRSCGCWCTCVCGPCCPSTASRRARRPLMSKNRAPLTDPCP